MGSSNWQNISHCIELIRLINPQKILDFGIGFGRWGILSREFLEIWDKGNYSGKWENVINGVEIFEDYIKPYHYYFYDNIFLAEGYEWIKSCKENYDLIIFGDVLEHFDKKTAEEIINFSLTFSRFILINIPIGNNWEQDAINDNKFEIHKSTWFIKDFKKYNFFHIERFRDFADRKFITVLLSDTHFSISDLIKKKYGKYYKVRNILTNSFNLGFIVEFIRKRKH